MEWRKLVQGGLVNQTVPLASEYGGQFPSSIPIHTPCTNQVTPNVASAYQAAGLQLSTPNGTACSGSGVVPFAGNRIPTSLMNANAAALLAAGIFPSANNGSQFVDCPALHAGLTKHTIVVELQTAIEKNAASQPQSA
jgi:hypothetical protein